MIVTLKIKDFYTPRSRYCVKESWEFNAGYKSSGDVDNILLTFYERKPYMIVQAFGVNLSNSG
jgi:hypothetical protein